MHLCIVSLSKLNVFLRTHLEILGVFKILFLIIHLKINIHSLHFSLTVTNRTYHLKKTTLNEIFCRNSSYNCRMCRQYLHISLSKGGIYFNVVLTEFAETWS